MLVLMCGTVLGASDPVGPEHPLAPMKVAATIDDIAAHGDLLPRVTRTDIV